MSQRVLKRSVARHTSPAKLPPLTHIHVGDVLKQILGIVIEGQDVELIIPVLETFALQADPEVVKITNDDAEYQWQAGDHGRSPKLFAGLVCGQQPLQKLIQWRKLAGWQLLIE